MLEKLLLAITVTLGLSLSLGTQLSSGSNRAISSPLVEIHSPLLEILAQSWR